MPITNGDMFKDPQQLAETTDSNKTAYIYCTSNLETTIKKENTRNLKVACINNEMCKCRDKSKYPLNGSCKTEEGVVYKTEVESKDGQSKVYMECTVVSFKKRCYKH